MATVFESKFYTGRRTKIVRRGVPLIDQNTPVPLLPPPPLRVFRERIDVIRARKYTSFLVQFMKEQDAPFRIIQMARIRSTADGFYRVTYREYPSTGRISETFRRTRSKTSKAVNIAVYNPDSKLYIGENKDVFRVITFTSTRGKIVHVPEQFNQAIETM